MCACTVKKYTKGTVPFVYFIKYARASQLAHGLLFLFFPFPAFLNGSITNWFTGFFLFFA